MSATTIRAAQPAVRRFLASPGLAVRPPVPKAPTRATPAAPGQAGSIAGCDRRPDPWDALADAMVRRMLATNPDLGRDAVLPSSATVIEVPGSDWIHPVAEAWREAVLGTDDVATDGDDESVGSERVQWLEFRRGVPGDTRGPSDGYRAVLWALGAGTPLLGFSPSPASRFLPDGLVKVATRRERVPAVDGAMLAEAVAAYTGRNVATSIPDSVARLVSFEDLELAVRADGDPDAYVARLTTLVGARAVPTTVPLDRLRGMDEAVAWGMDLADDLAALAAGNLEWADVDCGCLLAGPPGVGKTTWASSVAAWCGVPLVVGGLAKWQSARDGHLGHCLAAMRADFDHAREVAPCILLIDEADSFGDRSRADPGLKDYHTQVVNCLLEQLDGVVAREGVVVVAACNHPDRIDAAITRSGRLDRTIGIPLPDATALEGMLRHYLGADLADVGVAEYAMSATGGTGADVRRWVRGARRSARRARREMLPSDLAREIGGPETATPGDRRRAAVHEAGHAVIAAIDRPGCLRRVSVRRTGTSGGFVTTEPFGDHLTAADIRIMLRLLLAGRAAEQALLGNVSSGCGGSEASDLARATNLVMSALGSMGLGDDCEFAWSQVPDFTDMGMVLATRPGFSRRVSEMLAASYRDVLASVECHAPAIRAVADLLACRDAIDGQEVERVLREATVCVCAA
jgi:cell division protease FtsH